MPGKRVQFDDETFAALDLLARERMMTFQELADEAFRDLLRRHNRPVDLKEALRRSAGAPAEVLPFRGKAGGKRKPAAKSAGKSAKTTARKKRRK